MPLAFYLGTRGIRLLGGIREPGAGPAKPSTEDHHKPSFRREDPFTASSKEPGEFDETLNDIEITMVMLKLTKLPEIDC